MAKAFANLALSLTARTEKFTRGMKRASKTIFNFKQITKGIGLGIGAGAFSAVTRSLRGFVSNLKEAADSFDRLAKQARTIGVTTDALANLRLQGKLAGVGVNIVDKALLNIQRNAADAASGVGEAVQAFRDLNIDAAEFLDLPLIPKLRQLANALAKLSKAKQIGALADLAGLRGIEFGRVLSSFETGATSIGQTGLFERISGKDAEKVERFNDALTLLTETITRTTQKLIAEFAPAFVSVIGAIDETFRIMVQFGRDFRSFWDTWFLGMSQLFAKSREFFDVKPSRIALALDTLAKRLGGPDGDGRTADAFSPGKAVTRGLFESELGLNPGQLAGNKLIVRGGTTALLTSISKSTAATAKNTGARGRGMAP